MKSLQPTPDPGELENQSAYAAPSVDIAVRSYPTTLGPDNVDHHLIVRAERSLKTLCTNLPEAALPRHFDDVAYGMLIAAGMGGMPAGEMASAMALCKLVELVVKTPDWIMKMNRRKAAVVKRRMSERFRLIDEALKYRAEKEPERLGMSTSLTVACSLGPDLFLGHIGNSRAYLTRDDELHQLTHDHTLSQALIDAGIGESENAVVRGMRRVLTAALGSARLPVEPQIQHLQLRSGEQLLLCTDSLAESVEREGIQAILRHARSADEACRTLVEAARAGGADKLTVILAGYRFRQAS
jgi:PPM family protein phosphatase